MARAHSHPLLQTTLGRSLLFRITPRSTFYPYHCSALLVLPQGALGRIRSDCQRHYRFKKFSRLTGEKQVVRE